MSSFSPSLPPAHSLFIGPTVINIHLSLSLVLSRFSHAERKKGRKVGGVGGEPGRDGGTEGGKGTREGGREGMIDEAIFFFTGGRLG